MNFRRIFLVKCLLLLFPSVKSSISNWIYMAVNESALLNIAAAGTVYDATWLRDRQRLLQITDKKVKYYVNKGQCRCKILINGTLQIEKVMKEDSGKYTVMVYQQDGKLKAVEDTMLIVQEPVPQPILSAECVNKTVAVKCEVKQKTRDETFLIELSQEKRKKIQKNATRLELNTQHSGMFRCVVQNQVSKKTAEKVIKCSGQLDLYLILSIAGGAIFFVIFVILLIYCIRKKKAERLEDDDEEQTMQACQVGSEMVVRELPQPPCHPTPRPAPGRRAHNETRRRPLPQPQMQQQALPPRPRPRTQQRIPNHPRQRP
ncbi:PREDICTED: LOW QUALITY PROTEIN: T-cell surface antigen CD2-like [Tauraco erythrolophus]|uniref:LOW QUALITY PROTEIN: T-cell surface antigen CD2-like n=1 Tax=Tauraco erythrolophus TaxID=121530 RepID=UPI000523307E|nr:PREDICTED: LOW QUALITY PROTEIN: T-cell surface antigen CD2-like [Tauraco erythrolophus]